MPRQARIDAPGALHHIIARGIGGQKIFRGKRDFNDFVARLAAILTETKTPCFAWALLPNHFHLLLKTGSVPIATVMRRLLTGYAVSFNRRHRRHGHVFQNRYKSILCQEDAYFKELVRYIHLNPLRAGVVSDYEKLAFFPYSGHAALAGIQPNDWQDAEDVLRLFGARLSAARRRYLQFAREGAEQGRRPELTGGGLIRSLGGWDAVREAKKGREFGSSDERILGNGDFVEEVLKSAEESFRRRQALHARGVKLGDLQQRVAELLDLPAGEVMMPGKMQKRVRARSLLCYLAVRGLEMTMTSLAREAGLSVPAITMAVRRGEEIARGMNLTLQDAMNLKS